MFERLKSLFNKAPHRRKIITADNISLQDMMYLQNMNAATVSSVAGADVSASSAMGLPAVWRAVNFLAESIGSLPFYLYQNVGEDQRREAREHSLYGVLRYAANPYTTAMEFWSWLQGQAVVFGNGYALIERGTNGAVTALWQRDARYMRVEVKNGRILYVWEFNGQTKTYRPDQIFHYRGFSDDGLMGLSPIGTCANAVGLAQALQDFASSYFGNGAWMGGVVSVPSDATASDEEIEATKRDIREAHATAMKAHGVLFLQGGIEYKPINTTPEQSQALESRTYSVQDVARLFGVPPHVLMDMSGAIKSNIEQQSLMANAALLPWGTRLEQRVSLQLLLPGQRSQYFAEFDYERLIQTDIKTRNEADMTGRQAGIYCVDDLRAKRGLNALPGKQGKIYLSPLNMVPADKAYEAIEKPAPAPKPDSNDENADENAQNGDGDGQNQEEDNA